jgi:hypothetical protein
MWSRLDVAGSTASWFILDFIKLSSICLLHKWFANMWSIYISIWMNHPKIMSYSVWIIFILMYNEWTLDPISIKESVFAPISFICGACWIQNCQKPNLPHEARCSLLAWRLMNVDRTMQRTKIRTPTHNFSFTMKCTGTGLSRKFIIETHTRARISEQLNTRCYIREIKSRPWYLSEPSGRLVQIY